MLGRETTAPDVQVPNFFFLMLLPWAMSVMTLQL
jgi:hypothetical protein